MRSSCPGSVNNAGTVFQGSRREDIPAEKTSRGEEGGGRGEREAGRERAIETIEKGEERGGSWRRGWRGQRRRKSMSRKRRRAWI